VGADDDGHARTPRSSAPRTRRSKIAAHYGGIIKTTHTAFWWNFRAVHAIRWGLGTVLRAEAKKRNHFAFAGGPPCGPGAAENRIVVAEGVQ
jgi:hypothetical protein